MADRPLVAKGDAESINSLATSKILMHDTGFGAIGSGWQRIGENLIDEPAEQQTFFQEGLEFTMKPEDEQRLFNRLPEPGSFDTLPGMVVVPRSVRIPFNWNNTTLEINQVTK